MGYDLSSSSFSPVVLEYVEQCNRRWVEKNQCFILAFPFFYVKLAGTFSHMFRKHNTGIMLSSTRRMCSNLSSSTAFSYNPSTLTNIHNMESTRLKLIGSLQTPLKHTTILRLRKFIICSHYNCESYTAYNTCIFIGK